MPGYLILLYIIVYFVICGGYAQIAKKAYYDDIAWFAFIPILSNIL
ncbi:hypothetical protein [Paenibacillus chibensis]|nr:hypothetical protein [Paenibacillus chibensis]MEC0372722.1 hypothetical protein [Paenibacillus chibensis]